MLCLTSELANASVLKLGLHIPCDYLHSALYLLTKFRLCNKILDPVA